MFANLSFVSQHHVLITISSENNDVLFVFRRQCRFTFCWIQRSIPETGCHKFLASMFTTNATNNNNNNTTNNTTTNTTTILRITVAYLDAYCTKLAMNMCMKLHH